MPGKPPAPAARAARAETQGSARTGSGIATAKKPIESRLKRLDETLAKLNARKAAIDAQLADPAIYGDAGKEALKALILDQAYVARELAQTGGRVAA